MKEPENQKFTIESKIKLELKSKFVAESRTKTLEQLEPKTLRISNRIRSKSNVMKIIKMYNNTYISILKKKIKRRALSDSKLIEKILQDNGIEIKRTLKNNKPFKKMKNKNKLEYERKFKNVKANFSPSTIKSIRKKRKYSQKNRRNRFVNSETVYQSLRIRTKPKKNDNNNIAKFNRVRNIKIMNRKSVINQNLICKDLEPKIRRLHRVRDFLLDKPPIPESLLLLKFKNNAKIEPKPPDITQRIIDDRVVRNDPKN